MSPLSTNRQGADVLIIEDDPKIVELLTLHLGDIGLSTEAVSSGNRGLKRALEAEYRLVILDLMLPGLDGLEVCKRIRSEKRQLPILMLTAINAKFPLGFSPDDIDSNWLPVTDFLEKPVDFDVLTDNVARLLQQGSKAD